MWTRSPVQGIFGRSPFKPIQEHMKVVDACASETPALFEALAAGDKSRLLETKERIFDLEHEADKVKNEIRAHLPKSLFMPVDRRDLLDLLNAQDSIADSVQDVAGLLILKELEIPDYMKKLMPAYAARNVDAAHQCKRAIDQLDELLELGFKGRQVDRVEEILEELSLIESETDEQGIELNRALVGDEGLKAGDLLIWWELVWRLGDVADYSQDVGDRLRLLMAR